MQGTAADLIKMSMVKIQNVIDAEQRGTRIIMQVHDELVFDAHVSEIDYLRTHIDEIMCQALDLGVKIETGIGVGMNWLEAH